MLNEGVLSQVEGVKAQFFRQDSLVQPGAIDISVLESVTTLYVYEWSEFHDLQIPELLLL